MNRAFAVLYLAAFIDSTGIGLIIPIMPAVLHRLIGPVSIAQSYGGLIATFALMQFLFAPVLGTLSDRYGRRPILLLSLAVGVLDYLVTGFAPSLWMLYAARMVAGVTAANLSVVTASIADLAPEADRARRFGALNAVYGLGWIAGPVLGGTLGQLSPALPFVLAAGLSFLNLLLALVLLPEPRPPGAERAPIRAGQLNAFASLRWLASIPALTRLIVIFCMLCLLGQIPVSLWVLYGQARYGWSPAMVGWSFACFGLLFALCQMLLTGRLNRRVGDRATLMIGMGLDATGNLLMGLASRGWMPFAIMPLLASGGVGVPALQAGLAREVGEDRQGELQGTLSSLSNLAGVIGPLLATFVFGLTLQRLPGTIWFVGSAGYLGCLALAARRRRFEVLVPTDISVRPNDPFRSDDVLTRRSGTPP